MGQTGKVLMSGIEEPARFSEEARWAVFVAVNVTCFIVCRDQKHAA
jgi:hypothetical protein